MSIAIEPGGLGTGGYNLRPAAYNDVIKLWQATVSRAVRAHSAQSVESFCKEAGKLETETRRLCFLLQFPNATITVNERMFFAFRHARVCGMRAHHSRTL